VGTGTSAWTLLAPLESYETSDFQLLYQDCEGGVWVGAQCTSQRGWRLLAFMSIHQVHEKN
jgi:hypothetical protein